MTEPPFAIAARGYFALSLAAGRMLRGARYSTVRLDDRDARGLVRKQRRFYAPVLIWMSELLVRILGAGVRVLPQRAWHQREQRIYQSVYAASIDVEADGTLVLPRLAGRTLAALLEDPGLDASLKTDAISLATVALSAFHHRGFTHADAMAENVLVDPAAGTAAWFDFETVHDERRPLAWRRADDLRALLASCLVRTAPHRRAATLSLILAAYADADVTRIVVTIFSSVWRRPLALHLLQAPLSFESYCEIGELLRTGPGDRQRNV